MENVPPLLTFRSVGKSFGDVVAVADVSLEISHGEFFCLLGASGCGKTTLMRMVAGFETPDHGRICLDGEDLTSVPPHLRPVNMMFQSYALFPHMSVAKNVAFGLRQANVPRDQTSSRVAEMLALVQMDGLGDRRPDQLSGGQKQRVALARALARRPKLLLLDEPLAALDRKLRQETQVALKRIQHSLGTTFIVVTHDQDEALGLADRIAVMEKGRIIQTGSPADLYERPDTVSVATMVGDVNCLACEIVRHQGGMAHVRLPGLGMELSGVPMSQAVIAVQPAAVAACLLVRPQAVDVVAGHKAGHAHGVVGDVTYHGDAILLSIRTIGEVAAAPVVRARVQGSPARFHEGDAVSLGMEAAQCRVVPT